MGLLRSDRNLTLKKIVDKLYRQGARYVNGSPVSEEVKNGTKTSATRSHLQKAKEGLGSMRKLLNGNYGSLSDSDRKIVVEIV